MLKRSCILLGMSCCMVLHTKPPVYVTGSIYAELGNNLFQVATACALAWDHGAQACFPEMIARVDQVNHPHNVQVNYDHVFFRCDIHKHAETCVWQEPSMRYHPIPYRKHMRLKGYFQCEQYFAHHRERLLALFAPRKDDLQYIQSKYADILSHPCSVGVQVRKQWEDPNGEKYIQYGRDYLSKAAALFPEESLFVVSSNDLQFAESQLPENMKHVVMLRGEQHHVDLYLLSMCMHNIITNSTFGWWSAWLNRHEEKIVVAPDTWANPRCALETQDVFCDWWANIPAHYGPLNRPETYQ